MKQHYKTAVLLTWLVWFLVMPAGEAKTLLYVPADDRPVSLEYAVDTVKASKFDIIVPTVDDLANRTREGDCEKLWQWVLDNCKQADAIILSADTMIYGGLVDSRTHFYGPNTLQQRLDNFRKLRELNPSARIYVFSTIMRSPKMSAGGVEPHYYERYGSDIFMMTALQDKQEVQGLTADEQKRLQSVTAAIPKEYIEDWMGRRAKNFQINSQLVQMTKAGLFSYLILGRDDTSPFSQSHMESRQLNKMAGDIPASKFGTFPGADQLGMVMLTRAINDLTMQIPIVEVHYAMGAAANTIPAYEDQPVGKTILAHIVAAGGIVMTAPQRPDLVLVVNTPVNGITAEADSITNIPMSTAGMRQFADEIQAYLKEDERVAIADISFANGADNSLMAELAERKLLGQLSAYSGWNTASNTIGYAVGQGILAKSMSNAERKRLLAIRYLDDWAYQANIRSQIDQEVLYPRGGNLMYLNELEPILTTETERRIRTFAQKNLWGLPSASVHVYFPWNRMFEVRIAIDPQL